MIKRIGYIGLGLMGKPIASNLLKAGFELTVHNRSQEVVQELVALGALKADTPSQVAKDSEVIITNLPDSQDVEEVVLGGGGVLEGASEGAIFIDNSTIKPETARGIAEALAEKEVSALDAPVSGGDVGAKAGTLAIMVGGPREAFDRALPVFEAMGKTITYVGESGAVAMGELLMLAQKAGVSPARVVDAIQGGAAQCWALDMKPQRLFEGERGPGFKAYMMHKDLGIVLDTARSYGMPLPATANHMQLYEAMLQLGMRDLDNSAVVGVLEILAGEELEAAN
jgi:2-hydroxy-3-oxopropionate reductase